jgi:hypothetical protein
MTSLIGQMVINKKLPLRKDILGSTGRFLKDVVRHPIKTIKTGIANDLAANRLMKATTQLGRVGAMKKIAPAVATGVYKGGGKDVLIGTGGFVGSGLVPGGPVGALAGDYIGARIVRKGLEDIEALAKARRIRSNVNFQNLSKQQQRAIIAKRMRGYARGNINNELLEDTVGWGIGNGSASALSAAGVGIPLKGAAVAMGTMKDTTRGIRVGRRFARLRNSSPVDASAIATGRGLRRRYSVRRGNTREANMYDKVNQELERRLPYVPPGVDFSRRIYFLADFAENIS